MKNAVSRMLALAGVSLLATSISVAPANAESVASPPIEVVDGPSPSSAPDLESVTKNLSSEDQEKIASGEPMIINMDARSGMVESIEPLPPEPLFLGVKSNCSNVQGCYFGGGVPYADIGFTSFGGGTATGNWGHRTGYGSHTNYVSACSVATCYAAAAPNQLVLFDRPITGTSFTIYN